MRKKDKGITLVVLVITIVVLLILASVALYSVTNENGIVARSKESRKLTEISQEKEALETSIVKILKNKIENIIEENEEDRKKLEENLEKFTGHDNVTVSFANKEGYIFKVVFENKGREYYITEEGNIVDNTTPRYTVCVYFENIGDSEFSLEKTKTIEFNDEEVKKVQISNLVSEFSKPGVTFSHATIDGDEVTEFTEEKDKKINLYYNRNLYTLTLDKGNNITSVSGGGIYKFGQSIEISATLANTSGNNINFEKWESSNEDLLISRTEQNTTIKMPNGDITLTATASSNVSMYTIEYAGNGATGGKTTSSKHTYGVAKNLTANGFTKAGYKFTGWNTKADGTGTSYTDRQNVLNLSSTNGDIVTLYAQWSVYAEYTIEYAGNGATGGATSKSTHTYGIAKNLTTNGFTRAGYVFVGWNTKADGTGTSYSNEQSVINLTTVNDATITLYAQWTENTYTIAFDKNGGTGTMTSMTRIKYTDSVTLITNAYTRTGYTFSGWNTKADGTGTSYGDKATVKSLATSGTITLYAQWTENTYTIAFNKNGGTGTMASMTGVKYTANVTLTTNGFTRAGYTFSGWNTKADGTGTSYGDKATVKSLATSGTITLYAQWSNRAYTVTYNYSENGGTSATKTSASVNYNGAIDLSPTATKSGYIFVGWNTNKDATTKLDSLTMGTSDITLFAIYSKTVTATCNYYNGQSTTAQGTMYNKNTSVSVTLPTIANQTVSYVTYTQRGWSTSDAANATVSVASGGNVTLSANATYYASYQTTITGTFNYYTGTMRTSKTATATKYMGYRGAFVQSNFTPPTATTLNGYTQRGWSTSNAANATVATPTTANTQFYMSYSYTVELTYNVNGGNTTTINKTSGTAYMNYSGAKTGASLTITNTTVSRTGHTFAEKWNTSSNGTGTSYNKGTAYTFTASATLYAQWTPITYTISYNANGGSGAPASQTKTYGQTLTLSTTIPTRGGFTFLGWSTSATATTATYAAGGSYTTNAGTTLYAVWQTAELLEDFEDTDMNPGFTYNTSNFAVTSGQYRVSTWSGSAMSQSATVTITFTPTANGTLSFDYGAADDSSGFGWGMTATLNGTSMLNVSQWAGGTSQGNAGDAKSGTKTATVTAGTTYELVISASTYSTYKAKPFIDNLKVTY